MLHVLVDSTDSMIGVHPQNKVEHIAIHASVGMSPPQRLQRIIEERLNRIQPWYTGHQYADAPYCLPGLWVNVFLVIEGLRNYIYVSSHLVYYAVFAGSRHSRFILSVVCPWICNTISVGHVHFLQRTLGYKLTIAV